MRSFRQSEDKNYSVSAKRQNKVGYQMEDLTSETFWPFHVVEGPFEGNCSVVG